MRILTLGAALGSFLLLGATACYSQTAAAGPGPAPPPGPTPPELVKPPGTTTGVIMPPTNVDPAITKPTPPGVNFPTPAVRPPPTDQNGTPVVPK
jgi:hypothetical protein